MKARKIKGEGWDVFDSSGSSDGSMQICQIDDPDMCIPEDDPRYKSKEPTTPAFGAEGDYGAILHVIRLAKRGDEEALEALWEVLDEDGLVNRILWCEAMGWTGRDAAAYPEGYAEAWMPGAYD